MDNSHAGSHSSSFDDQDTARNTLLEKSADYEEDGGFTPETRKRRSRYLPWIVHLTIFIVYTTLFVYAKLGFSVVRGTESLHDLIYAPATKAVEYEKKVFHITVNDTNEFYGPSTPELDDAWHRLLKNMNVRLSAEDLEHLGQTSVKLEDGSGDFMGTLDVYHQLHCLQYIRQVLHSDHYSFHASNVVPIDHADHCIESLRQSIMCHPDLSILTYKWLPDFRGPWPEFESEHECVNWERVDAWAAQRAFNMFDPKFLIHPTLGPVFGSADSHEDTH